MSNHEEINHSIKIHPVYVPLIKAGIKTFELRKNDRKYQLGDIVVMEEFIPKEKGQGKYTGVYFKVQITYILGMVDGLEPEYVAWAFQILEYGEKGLKQLN